MLGRKMAARVNLTTGKIIGAEKGTFEWYHECGHIEYDNSAVGIDNGVRQNMALYCALLFIVCGYLFDIFKVFAGISVVYIIWLVIYEEIQCNIYAREHMNKKSKKNKKKDG